MIKFTAILCLSNKFSGPDSSFGIATELRAGRSGDRIPVGGDIFRTCPDRPWGPPSLLYDGYRVSPGGKERPGCAADPSPPSGAVDQERVELYLCSPYGPYGLYTASVPVQRCTLPLPFNKFKVFSICTSGNYIHKFVPILREH